MKQIILPFRNGRPTLTEAPAPAIQEGQLLIRTTASVVSAGTERMLIEFGKASWIGKWKSQPERSRQVLQKFKTDGLLPTLRAIRSKLDRPIPLGYSSAGIVLAVGPGVTDFKAGDRVACNGPHAEIVSVPRNLVAKIPEGLSDESAAFTTLGAIALQSIRLAGPSFGESVVVMGLGLVGQLTAQLLLAAGCRVFGIEPDAARRALAVSKGVVVLTNGSTEEFLAANQGQGADAVIIAASAQQDHILEQAAELCRKRGRIVLTGVVNMQCSRELFFKKELSFQVSSSYGPGRYDYAYEQKGQDYPIAYVRWTENRNFEAVLHALATGKLDVTPLIGSRIPFAEAERAYAALDEPQPGLATVFHYPNDAPLTQTVRFAAMPPAKADGLALIGAGNFASALLLPALRKAGKLPQTIISKNGLSAATLAQQFDIAQAGSQAEAVWADDQIQAVLIATPHQSHAALSIAALKAGKHVFSEKPLALNRQELDDITKAWQGSGRRLCVGFNRRFAPLAQRAKSWIGSESAPCNISITVNAGTVPAGHWLSDQEAQGGRIIGEACHFIDLCRYFTESPITAVCSSRMEGTGEDSIILLRFANGSQAAVHYFCNGAKGYDKERVEIFCGGRTAIIENWRRLRGLGGNRNLDLRTAQDKGHEALIQAWVKSLQGGPAPIPEEASLNSSLAAIAALESQQRDAWVLL